MRPLRTNSWQFTQLAVLLPLPRWELRVGTVCPWLGVIGQLPSHAFWSDSFKKKLLILHSAEEFLVPQVTVQLIICE